MTFDRRAYAREWKRRKRDAQHERTLSRATRCPKRFGPSICGGPIEARVDRVGRTRYVCLWCERRLRGVCRDCPAKIDGNPQKALRCARCRRRMRSRGYAARYRALRRERYVASYRRYAKKPDVRASRALYKRAWRLANPEKVRLQKRREGLRQSKHKRDYMTRYRKTHPWTKAVGHTCISCSTILRGHQKKCVSCKAQDREQARTPFTAAKERAA